MKKLIAPIFLSLIQPNISFAEVIEVSGRYEYRTDAESLELIGDFICFFPDKESISKIPRPKNDKRATWFCFRNKTSSKKIMHIKFNELTCGTIGDAVVKIKSYTVYRLEGDGFDTAELISSENIKNTTSLPCN